MGTDKALLRIAGKTLVELALDKLGTACADVAILSDNVELARFGRVIPDARQGSGPLGGIVAALETTPYAWSLILAVDVPFLPVAALHRLIRRASESSAVAVMAEAAGQAQPLCAVYASRFAPVLRRELESGRWKVRAAAEAAGVVDLVRFDEVDWFRNLNTPEEFGAAASGAEQSAG